MSLPINLTDLIHQRKVERTRIEYKADWNPEPIIHTITAFANDFDNMGGGYILIGVEEENGRPVLPLKGLDPEASYVIDGVMSSAYELPGAAKDETEHADRVYMGKALMQGGLTLDPLYGQYPAMQLHFSKM